MAKIRAWDSPLNAFERILHRRKDFLLLEKEERDGRLTKQHYHLKMLNTSGWEGSFGENMAESLCCPPGGITTLLIVLSSFLTDCYLRQPGLPCSLNPGDFCQLGPSVFPVRGVGAGSPQPWAQQASCCPSGLQHNRIWEVRADTFHELAFLRSL